MLNMLDIMKCSCNACAIITELEGGIMAVKYGSWAHSTDYQFKSAMDRYLFTELAYWADSKGIVRITQAELSARMQTSPRTVATGFKNLTDANLLKRLGHGRYGLVFGTPQAQPMDEEYRLPPRPPVPPNEICVMCQTLISVTSTEYKVRYSTGGYPIWLCGQVCVRKYDLP
jgi:hypothetical protein